MTHDYAAGRWNATASAQASDGSTSTQSVPITAYGLTLSGPNTSSGARALR